MPIRSDSKVRGDNTIARAAADALSAAAASLKPVTREADLDLFGDDTDDGWGSPDSVTNIAIAPGSDSVTSVATAPGPDSVTSIALLPSAEKAPSPERAASVEVDDSDTVEGSAPTSDVPAAEQRWCVRSPNTALVGPVPLALIQRGLNLGRVPEDAEIALEGSQDWQPVRNVLPADSQLGQPVPAADVAAEGGEVVVAKAVIAVGEPCDVLASTQKGRPAQSRVHQPDGPVATAASVASSLVVTSMPRPPAPQAPVAKVALRLPQPPPEPEWSKAATAVMPRVSPIVALPAMDPVVIPKQSMAPTLIAFSVTVVVAGLAALAYLLLN